MSLETLDRTAPAAPATVARTRRSSLAPAPVVVPKVGVSVRKTPKRTLTPSAVKAIIFGIPHFALFGVALLATSIFGHVRLEQARVEGSAAAGRTAVAVAATKELEVRVSEHERPAAVEEWARVRGMAPTGIPNPDGLLARR